MTPGDPASSQTNSPQKSTPPGLLAEAPRSPPTDQKPAKSMTPKSANVTPPKYISPYRQMPSSRSVSSPISRGLSPAGAHSTNFKDIVSRFNNKLDEKVPNPSNRIPAVAAASGAVRARKTPAWRSGSLGTGPSGNSSRSDSSPPSIGRGRSLSAQGSFASASRGKTLEDSQATRPRKTLISLGRDNDETVNGRLLAPLNTEVYESFGHRRSRSAMESHSPSAASLADNEDEDTHLGVSRTLHHRRSRSNIEITTSPPSQRIRVDPFSPKQSTRSPPTNRSGIPVPSRVTSPKVSSSPSTRPRRNSDGHPPPFKSVSLVPVPTSSHGSRHPPQPSKSPTLQAYISAPPTKISPPLRSSRGQRLPPAASAAPRQKSYGGQHSPMYTKDGRYPRGSVKNRNVGDRRPKEVKKKIPELNSVDFAARRAKIQSAFTKSLNESNGNKSAVVRRGKSARSLKGENEGLDNQEIDLSKSAVGDRIDEEDEEGTGEQEAIYVEKEPSQPTQTDDEVVKVNSDGPKLPKVLEESDASTSDVVESPLLEELEPAVEDLEARPLGQRPDYEETEKEERPISTSSKRFSQLFLPDRPFSGLNTGDMQFLRSLATVEDDESPVSPMTQSRSLSLVDPIPVEKPISVIITPESPRESTALTQVSKFLRPDSTVSDWSTESEMTGGALHLSNGTARRHLFNGIPVGVGPSSDGTIIESTKIGGEATTTLSPITPTGTSDTPISDRGTIVDVFDHYDEPREDFLKSYAETELDMGTTAHGEHETDSYDYTSCSEVPDSGRPSIDDQSEEWVSTTGSSPELDVHPSRRLSILVPDSPTTPRQIIEGAESPLPPTPPPKDDHFLPPAPPAKDTPRITSPSLSTVSRLSEYPPALPEIPRDVEPLGLAIQVLGPPPGHSSPIPPLPSQDTNPSVDRQHNTYPRVEQYSQSARQSLDYSYVSSRQSLDQYSSHRPSLEQSHAFQGRTSYSPSSSYYSEGESRRSFSFNVNHSQRLVEANTNPIALARGSASIHSQEQRPAESPEQKLLTRRRNLMKELVDTESSFFRDMTVAEEIYKGSANACSSITQEDVKVLFGNTDAVVQFSRAFLESLKAAVSSVYVITRGRSTVNSSAVSLANSANSGDEQGGKNAGPLGEILSEEEKDKKTYIGEAFGEMLYRMEKVYGDYCKNHDQAVARLAKLEVNTGVSIWLQECKACAEDLTNAWNLESLLIKPVQRVLKYPLLLTQLLECTPNNHPDYTALEVATKEMKYAADRINELKKRKDTVEKVLGGGKKRNETDIRHGISKGFARRAEKLRQSVGLSEGVVDEKYNRLFENYNMHFVQIQVIMRDIEIYSVEIQTHVEKLLEFTQTIKEFADVSATQHPEIESKWRRFDISMRELASSHLLEHKHRVRKHSIEPLEQLLKMHENPAKIMAKRNKKSVDYARFRAIKDRGDVPDKRTVELADAYMALNETLIDELPKLFGLVKKLVDVVLINFIELQGQWMHSWASKIRMSFTELDMPEYLDDIVKDFLGDQSYNEQSLNHLGVCNGSLNAMQFPPSFASSSASALSLDAYELAAFLRPKSSDGRELSSAQNRTASLASHSPTRSSFDRCDTERRHSGSTLSPSAAFAPTPPILPQLASSSRSRSGSTVLPQRTPPMPSRPQVQRSFSTMTGKVEKHPTEADAAALPRQSADFQSAYSVSSASAGRLEFHSANSSSLALAEARTESSGHSPTPASVAFSSAMPMDDDRDITNGPSRTVSRASSRQGIRRTLTMSDGSNPLFVAASLYEFNIDKQRREAGFRYLTYVQGEIFDVVGIKGEIWLARNQDDPNGEIGWIWCKHFARVPL